MTATDTQYERVAQWLDGRDIELSPDELRLAMEMRASEASLGRMLAVETPRAAMALARRRLSAEMARPERRAWSMVPMFAAAAAAIILLLLPTFVPRGWYTAPTQVAGHEDLTPWLSSLTGEDPELALLADEVDRMGAELLAASSPLDPQIDELQQSIEDFWLDSSAPDTPDTES